MVISYEITYEMTTSVRFCLSYDPLKWDYINFKVNITSVRHVLMTQTLSMSQCYYVYAPKCGHVIFMTRHYPLNKSNVT